MQRKTATSILLNYLIYWIPLVVAEQRSQALASVNSNMTLHAEKKRNFLEKASASLYMRFCTIFNFFDSHGV